MPSAAPSSEQRAARLLQSTYRELILARRCAAYERACALRDAAEAAAEAVANDKRQAEARLLRSPWRRVWPFAREAICIMLLAASLTLAPPPASHSAPPAMAVRSIDPTWKQLRAALLGALCINALLLSVLFALLALLARGWHRTLSTVFTLIIGGLLGGPGALLLLRCCEAAHVPLDATSLCMLSGNIVAPCTAVFLMPPQVCRPPTFLLRRIYVAASSALLAWTFSVVPWRGSHSARTRHRPKAHTVRALATAPRLTQCPHSPPPQGSHSARTRHTAFFSLRHVHGVRQVPWQTFMASAVLVALLDLIFVITPRSHSALTTAFVSCPHSTVACALFVVQVMTPCSPIRKLLVQSLFSELLPSLTFKMHGLRHGSHSACTLATASRVTQCPHFPQHMRALCSLWSLHWVCTVCALCVRCVCAVCAVQARSRASDWRLLRIRHPGLLRGPHGLLSARGRCARRCSWTHHHDVHHLECAAVSPSHSTAAPPVGCVQGCPVRSANIHLCSAHLQHVVASRPDNPALLQP
jgi:hypothetical protein